MVTRKEQDLKNYSHRLSRKTIPFACPKCGLAVLPRHFEKHCADTHGFDKLRSCVWCWGETSWISRKKGENVLHLTECFKKFLASHLPSPPEVTVTAEESPATLAATPLDKLLCRGHCFFDHDSRYLCRLEGALDNFSILPVDPPRLTYANDNLNLAAAYVRKYLETRDTHEWIHVMVKAVAFRSFRRALEEDRGIVGLLPFSCWCDGGPHERPRHRQHRHMVAVAPKGHFQKKIWKKVDTQDRPSSRYPCKSNHRIENPLHLVSTLGYLSQRMSSCEFRSKKSTGKKKIPRKEKHFYIFTTLPVNFELPLVVLWKEGLYEYLYQKRFQNVSIKKVVRHPMIRVCKQWRQKIKYFYNLPADVALPVDLEFVPTNEDEESPYYVHLMGGRKLRFKRLEKPLDMATWLEKQAEGGNRFYGAVKEDTWTPRPRDQRLLNSIMPLKYRIRELEVANACLKRKLEVSEEECRAKSSENEQLKNELYGEEIKRLKLTNTELESENEQSKLLIK